MTRLPSHQWINIGLGFHHLLPKRRSAITDLPVELLEIIFLHYAHDTEPYLSMLDTARPSFSSRAQEAINPMVLGEVSQQWRDISRGLQQLWAKIYISEPTSKHVDLAKLWLSLAAPSPLTLVVAASVELESMPPLLELFLSHYDAWYIFDIHLSLRPGSLILPVPNSHRLLLPKYPPPILSSIHIGADNILPFLLQDEPRSIDILHTSPMLRRVNWTSSCYSLVQALEKFPNWSALVQLVCAENTVDNRTLPTVTDCLTVLAACPVLEHLDVFIYPFPSDSHPSSPDLGHPLYHSSLRTLTVKTSAKLLRELLKLLVIPTLEGLAVQYLFFLSSNTNDFLTDAHPVHDMLERSSCKLEDLSLETPFALETALLDIVSSPQLRHLRNLRLTRFMTEQAIGLLTRRPGDPQSLTILPQLQRLTFCNHPPFDKDVPIALLKDMLVSRITPISSEGNNTLSCLTYANLDLRELDVWDYRKLKKLGSVDFTIIPMKRDVVPTLYDLSKHVLLRGRYLIREA